VAYLEGKTCGTLHAFTWSSYYIWLESLEGELVETLLSLFGGVYLFISWSFGMVKNLIHPYLFGVVL
jgi:hypothetical protein